MSSPHVMMWVMAFVLAATGSCAKNRRDSGHRMGRTVDNNPDISTISKELGIELPAGSRVLGTHRESGMDDYLGVKLEMPKQALTGFVANSPIDSEAWDEGAHGYFGSDQPGFWDPNTRPRLRSGQAELPGARFLSIGYDDSAADKAIVFIVNYGT